MGSYPIGALSFRAEELTIVAVARKRHAAGGHRSRLWPAPFSNRLESAPRSVPPRGRHSSIAGAQVDLDAQQMHCSKRNLNMRCASRSNARLNCEEERNRTEARPTPTAQDTETFTCQVEQIQSNRSVLGRRSYCKYRRVSSRSIPTQRFLKTTTAPYSPWQLTRQLNTQQRAR